MSNVGIAHMRHAAQQLESIKGRIAKHKEKAERVATHLLTTAEVVGGAVVGGFLLGRFPDKTILNQKPDLVGGLALVATAAFDVFGKQSDHVLAIGQGMLASAGTRLGVSQGASLKDTGHFAKVMGEGGGDPNWGALGQRDNNVMPFHARVATEQAAHFARTGTGR